MTRLPTWQEMCRNARGHLSQARDELNSDWAEGTVLSDAQAEARVEAMRLIAAAKAALEWGER